MGGGFWRPSDSIQEAKVVAAAAAAALKGVLRCKTLSPKRKVELQKP